MKTNYLKLKNTKLDLSRYVRTGIPEFVYGEGKTLAQLKKIIEALYKHKHPIIITRMQEEIYLKLKKSYAFLNYNKDAKVGFYFEHKGDKNVKSRIRCKKFFAILSAGSSDLSIAEEAAVILELFNIKVKRYYDCGVAGLKRLIDIVDELNKAELVICVAGMDGVLPTLTAGLIKTPIVAVPTSVGYGANFKGLSALLTMLNACAPGISVVNIDSGFSAACFALKFINTP